MPRRTKHLGEAGSGWEVWTRASAGQPMAFHQAYPLLEAASAAAQALANACFAYAEVRGYRGEPVASFSRGALSGVDVTDAADTLRRYGACVKKCRRSQPKSLGPCIDKCQGEDSRALSGATIPIAVGRDLRRLTAIAEAIYRGDAQVALDHAKRGDLATLTSCGILERDSAGSYHLVHSAMNIYQQLRSCLLSQYPDALGEFRYTLPSTE